jgi:Nucleotidyltransferase of unknown function (DUF6036)
MESETLCEPWLSFFKEIDGQLEFEISLELLGGFVLKIVYGSPRTTSDIDTVSISPKTNFTEFLNLAGEGSVLHKKHKIYLDWVGVAQLPENYEERLVEIFPKYFKHLRLFALDAYDIALSKIERNIQRDRDDVKYLAKVVPFDLDILRKRYFDELRIYLGNPKREDLTLKLWIEMIDEDRSLHR